MKIQDDITLDRLFESYPESMTILARHGLHTLSCPSELYLPIKKIAELRGMPIAQLLKELNNLAIEKEPELSGS